MVLEPFPLRKSEARGPVCTCWHSTPPEQRWGCTGLGKQGPFSSKLMLSKPGDRTPCFCSLFLGTHPCILGLLIATTSWTPLLQTSAPSWPSGMFSHPSLTSQCSPSLSGPLWHSLYTAPTLSRANFSSLGFFTSREHWLQNLRDLGIRLREPHQGIWWT